MVSDVMQAARYGDLEDVQACLAQGTSVSSQDTQGRTGMYEFQVWLLNAKHSFIESQFRGISTSISENLKLASGYRSFIFSVNLLLLGCSSPSFYYFRRYWWLSICCCSQLLFLKYHSSPSFDLNLHVKHIFLPGSAHVMVCCQYFLNLSLQMLMV